MIITSLGNVVLSMIVYDNNILKKIIIYILSVNYQKSKESYRKAAFSFKYLYVKINNKNFIL